jgi:hypothetical protein
MNQESSQIMAIETKWMHGRPIGLNHRTISAVNDKPKTVFYLEYPPSLVEQLCLYSHITRPHMDPGAGVGLLPGLGVFLSAEAGGALTAVLTYAFFLRVCILLR